MRVELHVPESVTEPRIWVKHPKRRLPNPGMTHIRSAGRNSPRTESILMFGPILPQPLRTNSDEKLTRLIWRASQSGAAARIATNYCQSSKVLSETASIGVVACWRQKPASRNQPSTGSGAPSVAAAPSAVQLSNDPFLVEKVRDIVGLYLNPTGSGLGPCAWTRGARFKRWSLASRCWRGDSSAAMTQENFNFSSTYSESSIMRSAICSACMPAKFLSTNSLT